MVNSAKRLAILWGGAAGQGMASIGVILSKYLNRLGYYVHAVPGTQSTIRGGHIWIQVEFSAEKIYAYDRRLNFIVALTTQTIDVHLRDLESNSVLLYDSEKVDVSTFQDELNRKDIKCLPIPLSSLAKDIDKRKSVLINTISIGVIISYLQLPREQLLDVIKEQFEDKSALAEINQQAFTSGWKYHQENSDLRINIEKPQDPAENYIVLNGNDAFSIGAVAAGLKFLAQYPITPASSTLSYIAKHAKRYGVTVTLAEDELAALQMVVGASFAGVRAMTATSGPGVSLMAETLGYASCTETPCVLMNSMRGGPSTGVPTKMEQSDLFPVIWASHGESPRAVFAPRSIAECFDISVKAFNIADKYQMPVIVLLDFHLSFFNENIPEPDLNVKIERGLIWEKSTDEFPVFKRFQLTEDGISPRAFPPNPDAIHILVGAEHDESSHSMSGNRCGLPEFRDMRIKQVKKRMKKLDVLAENDMSLPEWFGPENAEKTLICWGTTTGAVKETVRQLNLLDGCKWNALTFSDLFPLSKSKLEPELKKIQHGVMVEMNFTGQFETLICNVTGWKPQGTSIRILDGEPPSAKYLIEELKLNGEVA